MDQLNAEAQRYPLSWPIGWQRTHKHQRRRARFLRRETVTSTTGGGSWQRSADLSVEQARRRLEDELRRLGATAVLLSSNVELRLDGMPRSDRRPPEDPGVAIYFKLKNKDRCLAVDRWDKVADNIAALAAHIDAIRRIERYGVGTLDQAFAGYTALPPTEADWWLILGVSERATLEEVETAFRERAKKLHPDVGGTHEDMAQLTEAREYARKARA